MLSTKRFEGLRALPTTYEGIFERAGRECFFVGLPWFRLFEGAILDDGERVAVYGIEDAALSERPVAALVLKERHGKHRPWSAASLESLANYYTARYSLPGADGDDAPRIATALAAALWANRRAWDFLHLWPLDPQAPSFDALASAFRSAGMLVQTHFCFGNWYLEVAGRSYAEYFKGLPSVLRKNIPYSARRLEREHRVRMEIVTRVDELEAGLADYERVYRASWRPIESHPEFIRGLARLAAERGWLRLGLLYLDEEPAAAELWIAQEGVASIYKVSYDERFAKLSVGTVLTAHVMEHVIDRDRVRVVDYLSGDDAYKRNWMSHRRERWGILAFNPQRPVGLLLAARHMGGRALKRALARVGRFKRGDEAPA